MAFPVVAFTLATNGEIQIGTPPADSLRLFLIQEIDAEGVGVLRTNVESDAPLCVETSISYVMWVGEGESGHTCQCFDAESHVTRNEPGRCGKN